MNLPVTLVGGFLGAGKTSLLHHFLSEHAAAPVAVLVEGAGSLNLDAQAIRGLCGAMRRGQDVVCEILPDAEVDWLADKLRELVRGGSFERILIEVSGTSNAARLGRFLETHVAKFSPEIELRQIVCVVDALDFYHGTVVPTQRGISAPFLDFQREQIEGASLLVLNKCDLVETAERAACVELLRRINPGASRLETAYGELPAAVWDRSATVGQLDFALEKRPHPEGGLDSPDLNSILYRAYRPFHPARFWDWFEADHPGLLRVKGLIWLATRNLLVGGISRTRGQNSCGGAGIWWAALPREEWPPEPEALARMQQTWREPYGDRRQEFILIGDAALLPKIARQLEGCLLTDEEYARAPRDWLALPDPFPAWDVGGAS
jgi:G3E family GTPase